MIEHHYIHSVGSVCWYVTCRYEVPGEFLHWAGDNGISAIDIELPNENAVHAVNSWGKTHYEQNLSAVLAILGSF